MCPCGGAKACPWLLLEWEVGLQNGGGETERQPTGSPARRGVGRGEERSTQSADTPPPIWEHRALT